MSIDGNKLIIIIIKYILSSFSNLFCNNITLLLADLSDKFPILYVIISIIKYNCNSKKSLHHTKIIQGIIECVKNY